jgi:glutathione S-transferase
MIKFYYNTSPKPAKVALFLEECRLPYEVIPVDTRKGEQFAPDFIAINPNSKVPAIVDGEVRVFDSNAILLYLAEKTGQFLPKHTPKARAELFSWMMFVATGVGPYSGQAVHFKHFAPKGLDYPSSATSSRRAATTTFSMHNSRTGPICSAASTRSWTWRRGAGLASYHSSSAMRRGRRSRI